MMIKQGNKLKSLENNLAISFSNAFAIRERTNKENQIKKRGIKLNN